jgi:hypothetical protein
LFLVPRLPLSAIRSAEADWWRTWLCLAIELVARLASSAANPMATTSTKSCFLSEILIVAAFLIRPDSYNDSPREQYWDNASAAECIRRHDNGQCDRDHLALIDV